MTSRAISAKESVVSARYGPLRRITTSARRAPIAEEAATAATIPSHGGAPAYCHASPVVYAPSIAKVAGASENCPVYPASRFHPDEMSAKYIDRMSTPSQ